MKKLLLTLLCLPIIGFGQENDKKSTFNFNNANNYNTEYSKKIAKKYYSNTSKSDFNKSIREKNDSTLRYMFYSKDKTNYSVFNKGLIHLLSKAIQKGREENPSILKTVNENNKILN
jgi:hypothetical protein